MSVFGGYVGVAVIVVLAVAPIDAILFSFGLFCWCNWCRLLSMFDIFRMLYFGLFVSLRGEVH